MKHARLLIALLLVATVLVDSVAVSMVLAEGRPPDDISERRMIPLIALVFAQSSLVAVWAGFGERSIAWRLMGLILTAALCGGLVAWIPAFLGVDNVHVVRLRENCIIFLTAQTGLIFCGLMVARVADARLVRPADSKSFERGADQPSRVQFSLAYAFSWMTAAAVVLGILKYAVSVEAVSWMLNWWLELSILSSANAALALCTLWAVLGTRWLALRVTLLCVALLAAIGGHIYEGGFGGSWVVATLPVLEALWMIASLYVFRVAGYRVVRRAGTRLQHPPN
jgi:hypothetical protein